MGFFSDDIVRDIFNRIIQAAQQQGGFDEAMAEQIERQVRADWGGDSVYVLKDVESLRLARNEKILADWQGGNRDIGRLSALYGLTPRQIRNIVR